jgi:hypothetical protein
MTDVIPPRRVGAGSSVSRLTGDEPADGRCQAATSPEGGCENKPFNGRKD